jgi:hypothetical protein
MIPYEATDVAARIGEIERSADNLIVRLVGDGIYALVAVFADGARVLSATGFESVAEAELYSAYMAKANGAAQLNPPVSISAPLALVRRRRPTPLLGYEVVTYVRAVAAHALDHLTIGGETA